MSRNYHNHTLQTNPRHCDEEQSQDKTKLSSDSLSLFPIKMSVKTKDKSLHNKTWNKHRTPTMGATINNESTTTCTCNPRLITDSSRSHLGLNTYYWFQIFSLASFVVKIKKKLFSSHIGFPTIAKYNHRKTILSNETKVF